MNASQRAGNTPETSEQVADLDPGRRESALRRDIAEYGAHAARPLLATIAAERVGHLRAGAAHLIPRGSTAPPPPGSR